MKDGKSLGFLKDSIYINVCLVLYFYFIQLPINAGA